MEPNRKALYNKLERARRNRSARPANLPPGTTPPLHILQDTRWKQATNRFMPSPKTSQPSSYTSSNTPGPLFEFIFVRHGESCANAIQHLGGLQGAKHSFYSDPELTLKGTHASELKSPLLMKVLFETIPREFTLGSSSLLRAQETAYFMLGKQTEKPIHVFPHLGEVMLTPFEVFGKRRILPGDSKNNIPLSSEEQMAFLSQYKDPPFQKGKDLRETPYEPNLQRFLEWALQHPDEFPEEGGVRRVVIFTHSNLLLTQFPYETCINKEDLNKEGKLGNNDFLVTIYKGNNVSLEGKELLHPDAQYPKWYYYNTQESNPVPHCGIEPTRCRRIEGSLRVPVTKPCVGTGGKRKTRHLQKRSHRRNTRRRLQK